MSSFIIAFAIVLWTSFGSIAFMWWVQRLAGEPSGFPLWWRAGLGGPIVWLVFLWLAVEKHLPRGP